MNNNLFDESDEDDLAARYIFEDEFIDVNDELLGLRADVYSSLGDNDLDDMYKEVQNSEEEFSDKRMGEIVDMWISGELETPENFGRDIYVVTEKPEVKKKDPFLRFVQVYRGDTHVCDVTDDRVITYRGNLVSDQQRHGGLEDALGLFIKESLDTAKRGGDSGLRFEFNVIHGGD